MERAPILDMEEMGAFPKDLSLEIPLETQPLAKVHAPDARLERV